MATGFTLRERLKPEFVRFEEGDVHEGVLTRIDNIMKDGKRVSRYTLADGAVDSKGIFRFSGKSIVFLGTFQIDEDIQMRDRGHWVSVRCTGTDSSATRNGNPMKVFKIFVSEEAYTEFSGKSAEGKQDSTDILAGTEIGDDDIPF